MRLNEGEPQKKPLVPHAPSNIFTEAARKFPHDFTKQGELIVHAHRPAGLPDNFQPLGMGDEDKRGRREPHSAFGEFILEQQRLRQEAAARELEQQRQAREAEIQEQRVKESLRAATQKRLDERKLREETRGRSTSQELAHEVHRLHLDSNARDIQQLSWKNSQGVHINISEISRPDVVVIGYNMRSEAEYEELEKYYEQKSLDLNDKIQKEKNRFLKFLHSEKIEQYEQQKKEVKDEKMKLGWEWREIRSGRFTPGTVIDYSKFGIKLSYYHEDVVRKEGQIHALIDGLDDYQTVIVDEQLTLGIGYFGEDVIPEAQGSVTDEDLEKGIKAYFVEVTKTAGNRVLEARTVVIPYNYVEHRQTFHAHLYESAASLSPDQVIPDAKARIKEWKRKKREYEKWERKHRNERHMPGP
jgi:hypothetical protein